MYQKMKKQNIILKTLVMTGLIILSAGCNDILEIDNPGILPAENHFKTGNDVNASIVGLYSLLQPVSQQVVLYNEVRADLLQTNTSAGSDMLQLAIGEINPGNKYLNLRDFYKVISSCNDIINKMEGVLSLDPSYTATINKQYRAEVIGVRTWTYFQISKIFGRIVYFKNAITNTEDKTDATELDAKSAINQLVDDLSTVINDYIYSYPSSYSVDWRISRFNTWAARMLYAELLMYKGAFNQTDLLSHYLLASKQLWMVISSDSTNTSTQMYKVGSVYEKANWQNIFTSLTTSVNEVVWAIDFSKTNEQTHALHMLYFTEPQLTTTTIVANYLTGSDYRTAASLTNNLVRKFSVNKTTFEADAPIILYRAADLHLLYAEAINRLGNPDLAVKIINTGYAKSEMTTGGEKLYNAQSKGIRARAGLAALTLGTTDKQIQAEGYIRDERIRELAFEGKRWESLVRYAILEGKNTITVRGQSFPIGKWYAPSN
jgi:starch-binding outer membrane protein, SusD/RagB family